MRTLSQHGCIRLTLAMLLISGARGTDHEAIPASGADDKVVTRGRALLREGQAVEAVKLVQPTLKSDAGDVIWALAGEIRFRLGDFDTAARNFRTALDIRPDNARALWGLGRIERLHFRLAEARDLFAKAYRSDCRDPEIVLSYLQF